MAFEGLRRWWDGLRRDRRPPSRSPNITVAVGKATVAPGEVPDVAGEDSVSPEMARQAMSQQDWCVAFTVALNRNDQDGLLQATVQPARCGACHEVVVPDTYRHPLRWACPRCRRIWIQIG